MQPHISIQKHTHTYYNHDLIVFEESFTPSVDWPLNKNHENLREKE